MTPPPPRPARSTRGRGHLVAAAVLAVAGVAMVAFALLRPASDEPPTPPAPAPQAGAHDHAHPPAETGPRHDGPSLPVLDYSDAVHLRIPRIDVSSRLVPLGLDEAGRMETPVPVDLAGWFRPSPPPGVPGATVIAGHVTWDQVPTVFYRLARLEPGDRATVVRRDGVAVVYRVTRVQAFPKDRFPSRAVYSQPDRPELRLITCGGTYDPVQHRYPDNVVVWATAVTVRHAPT